MTNTVRVSVLGASGSIGVSALDVIASGGEGSPDFSVVALTANRNVAALAAVVAAPVAAVLAEKAPASATSRPKRSRSTATGPRIAEVPLRALMLFWLPRVTR
jgi:1-deoxy-D-xylulose 5-phosphate reductoisomerase